MVVDALYKKTPKGNPKKPNFAPRTTNPKFFFQPRFALHMKKFKIFTETLSKQGKNRKKVERTEKKELVFFGCFTNSYDALNIYIHTYTKKKNYKKTISEKYFFLL